MCGRDRQVGEQIERRLEQAGQSQEMEYERKAADPDSDRCEQNRRRQSQSDGERLTDRNNDKQAGNDGQYGGRFEHDYTNGRADIVQISTCPPSSTTRFGGIRKNSVAASAFRCIASNSLRRMALRRL